MITYSWRYISAAGSDPIGTPVISTRGSIAQTSVLRNNNVVSLYIQAVVFVFIGRRVFTTAMPAVQKFAFYYAYLSLRPCYNFFMCPITQLRLSKEIKKNGSFRINIVENAINPIPSCPEGFLRKVRVLLNIYMCT